MDGVTLHFSGSFMPHVNIQSNLWGGSNISAIWLQKPCDFKDSYILLQQLKQVDLSVSSTLSLCAAGTWFYFTGYDTFKFNKEINVDTSAVYCKHFSKKKDKEEPMLSFIKASTL
jgi:hypothetical protein